MNTDERRCLRLPHRARDRRHPEVSNILGAGFLEKVYERGIRATAQPSFAISYKGRDIGEYYADILVEDVLVVELKCVDHLANAHIAQCLNYLQASGRHVCLLVNFQRPKAEWRRIVNGYQADQDQADQGQAAEAVATTPPTGGRAIAGAD